MAIVALHGPVHCVGTAVFTSTPPKPIVSDVPVRTVGVADASRQRRETKFIRTIMDAMCPPPGMFACIAVSSLGGLYLATGL